MSDASNRNLEREFCFQFFFQYQTEGTKGIKGDTQDLQADLMTYEESLNRHLTPGQRDYCLRLLKLAHQNYDLINKLIEKNLVNWKLSRISRIDHTLLLVCLTELLLLKEVGNNLVIDSAVELAKTYGNKDSFAFINAICDKLAKQHENERPS